jgi:S-adenosylmethionine:tRNA ribosyltransferase-isomerase
VNHSTFSKLPEWLRAGDLLVVNRSRVFPARFLGERANGGKAEVLLLRSKGDGTWEALLRPGRRLRTDDVIRVGGGLTIRVESGALPPDGRRVVRPSVSYGNLEETMTRVGHTPLPPYVRRNDRPEDRERYQTIYARESGSVAAPTAGLHFTEELLGRLVSAGIGCAEIILHVGHGTFQPVKVENVEDHRVAAEPFWIPEQAAEAIGKTRANGGRVLAVGTTVTRALETAARADGTFQEAGETDLVIAPGHRFRAIDGLLTNFHLPRSSLLLLVCSFAGRDRILAAYAEALQQGYRFYSYGDAMLIL